VTTPQLERPVSSGSETGRPVRLGYVPALDGIRAVAVLGVLLYHGGAPGFGGGFLGVNIFFVLSGFLITSLLVGEWASTSAIRLGQFWARRARRLLPALLVLLIAVALYVRFVADPGQFPDLRFDSLSTLLYVANWHFIYSGGNYFDLASQSSPVVHMWSLSIEEQFYIVWPPVALLLLHVGRRLRPSRHLWPIGAVAAVGALASAATMRFLFEHGSSVTRVYEGTDTRCQDILVGASLAIGMAMWAARRHPLPPAVPAPATPTRASSGRRIQPIVAWEITAGPLRSVLQAFGWCTMVGGLYLWSQLSGPSPMLFKGGSFLFAIGVALVLFCVVTAQGLALAVTLGNPVFRYIGKISYGTYLWHVPLFVVLDASRLHIHGLPLLTVRVASSLAVASASYYLVEQPIRRNAVRSLGQWKTWLATSAAFVAVAVITVAATAPTGTPATGATSVPVPVGPRYLGRPVVVTMFGDSLAFTAGLSLSDTHASDPYDVTFHSEGTLGCGVMTDSGRIVHGVESQPPAVCAAASPASVQWPHVWADRLAEQHPNVVMVLAGRWEAADQILTGTPQHAGEAGFDAVLRSDLELAVRTGTATGAYMVLLTAPCNSSGEQPDGQAWPEDTPARRLAYDRVLRSVAAEHPANVEVMDFGADVCPGGRFHSVIDGIRIRTVDGVHFDYRSGTDQSSAKWLAWKLLPEAVRVGRLQISGQPLR